MFAISTRCSTPQLVSNLNLPGDNHHIPSQTQPSHPRCNIHLRWFFFTVNQTIKFIFNFLHGSILKNGNKNIRRNYNSSWQFIKISNLSFKSFRLWSESVEKNRDKSTFAPRDFHIRHKNNIYVFLWQQRKNSFGRMRGRLV